VVDTDPRAGEVLIQVQSLALRTVDVVGVAATAGATPSNLSERQTAAK